MRIPPLLTWVLQEPRGPEWIEALPNVLATCAERWKLEIEEPFEASQVSYAAPATTQRGERVVVKVQFPDREAAHEAEALNIYAGRGHVRLLAHAPELNALLIERCEPGTSVGQASVATVEAVTLGILQRVWPATRSFLRLKDKAIMWDHELAEANEAAANHRASDQSSAHFAQARQVLKALVDTQAEPVLVNSDLHRDNVLQSTREPWLVIDPKPIIAEREFALANRLPMFGATEIENTGIEVIERLNAYAGTLELNADRVRGWAFVRSVLWSLGGGQLRPHFSRVAGLLLSSIRSEELGA